jgi:hypothetical protein
MDEGNCCGNNVFIFYSRLQVFLLSFQNIGIESRFCSQHEQVMFWVHSKRKFVRTEIDMSQSECTVVLLLKTVDDSSASLGRSFRNKPN